MTKWNVGIDSLFTTVKAQDVPSAKLIKVIPVTNAGSAEICKIDRDTVSDLYPRSKHALIPVLDWWKEEHIFSIPKEAFPVQLREEQLCATRLRPGL